MRSAFPVVGVAVIALLSTTAALSEPSNVPGVRCEATLRVDPDGPERPAFRLVVVNLTDHIINLNPIPSLALEGPEEDESYWAPFALTNPIEPLPPNTPWRLSLPAKAHLTFWAPVQDLLWSMRISSYWPAQPMSAVVQHGRSALIFDAGGCKSQPVLVDVDSRGISLHHAGATKTKPVASPVA